MKRPVGAQECWEADGCRWICGHCKMAQRRACHRDGLRLHSWGFTPLPSETSTCVPGFLPASWLDLPADWTLPWLRISWMWHLLVVSLQHSISNRALWSALRAIRVRVALLHLLLTPLGDRRKRSTIKRALSRAES